MKDCNYCPVQKECYYPYKVCDCVLQRKFTPNPNNMETKKIVTIPLHRDIVVGDIVGHDVGYSFTETEEQAQWSNERFNKPQQILIVDDSEIKEGDWYYQTVSQVITEAIFPPIADNEHIKIISSNILISGIPLIANDDLIYICSLMNKGVFEVAVKYLLQGAGETKETTHWTLKINNGYVSIVRDTPESKDKKEENNC